VETGRGTEGLGAYAGVEEGTSSVHLPLLAHVEQKGASRSVKKIFMAVKEVSESAPRGAGPALPPSQKGKAAGSFKRKIRPVVNRASSDDRSMNDISSSSGKRFY